MFLLNISSDPWGCLSCFKAASAHAAVSHHPSARDVSHSESPLKARSKFYVRYLNHLFSVNKWDLERRDVKQQINKAVTDFPCFPGTSWKLLLKVALGEIHLIIGISQKVVFLLISQSSAGCDGWHRLWFKASLSLKDGPFAPPRDCIFWNSSSAFCMKMADSSGAAQKQKHDAVHVFIYSLPPQHIETCHLSVSDGEGRKGPTDSNVNSMWLWERLWLWCFREQSTRCISARWNEGNDTGRDESDSWELHMWCFWLNIPYFSTYEHGSNICSGNQHPHVEDYSNCFSNMLRSETAQFSHSTLGYT